ncbi:MAG: M20/M25/M40 family metallo-hydrolase [Acidobacteria bacterium]|nr:M20/M25/M40 family metallo-hydrolase [Acidobacteriota bacterium]
MDALELTRELIRIESISGNEAALVKYLAAYLERLGLVVELQEAEANRPNLYARRGEPVVVLSTHTDTVPPYVELREDDDYIYGRGACDTKGLMAAMLKAAEKLIAENVNDFGVLLLVGEENGSIGASVANAIPNACKYLINGEPTESKLVLGSKGTLRAILRASGRAAHSAYPHMGESAIEKLLDVLTDVRQMPLPRDETLGATTLNIGLISGGIAPNVIPPAAQAEILLRVVSDTATLKKILEATVAGRVGIEYGFQCEPVFMEKLEGYETDVVAFTTDIPALTNWGKPLLYGPGSILDAHTAGEKIRKRDLLDATEVYAAMVRQLQHKIV